jgi:hypothetical protein
MLANIKWLLSLTIIAVLSACSGSSDDNDPNPQPQAAVATSGLIEVIHASQDAPAVNVLAGGSEVIGNLGYREAAFLTVDTGDIPVEVEGILPAGAATTVIPAAGAAVPVLNLGEDQRITVIAVNNVANIEPIVLVDDQPAVDAAEVRIRVVHAASIAQAVEVWVSEPGLDLTNPGNGTLINAVFDFKGLLTPDPLVVPAGDYQVRVTAPGDPGNPFYDSGTIGLPGGADLVIAAVVNTGPGNSPIALVASTGSALLEFNDVGTPADVRVVHASPNAPAVDVLVNDVDREVQDAEFKDVTDYLSLDPDTYNFKVVPAMGTPTDAVIDEDLALVQGSASTVLAVGAVNDPNLPAIQALLLNDDNRRVATEARIRLVHTSVLAGDVDIYVAEGGTLTPDVDTTIDFVYSATGIPFKADTGYLSLPDGSYDIAITPTGSTGAAIGPLTVDLAAGGIYTAVARDETGIGLPLGVILMDDFASP